MRYFIIYIIYLYRRIVPAQHRNTSLFRESCSLYIERVAIEAGGIEALRAFITRFHCCRPGYRFEIDTENNKWQLVCANGSRFSESHLASNIIDEFRSLMAHAKLQQRNEA